MSEEIKKEGFEEKLENSKKLLEALGDQEITLEQSVKLYKQGLKELADAQKMLDEAKLEFEEINSKLS